MERLVSRLRVGAPGIWRTAPSPKAGLVLLDPSLDCLNSPLLQIGLEVKGKTKGKMTNTLVESCNVGIDVVSGARVDISSGSRCQRISTEKHDIYSRNLRVSRCREQGILFRGHGVGVWRGEEAVREAAIRGGRT